MGLAARPLGLRGAPAGFGFEYRDPPAPPVGSDPDAWCRDTAAANEAAANGTANGTAANEGRHEKGMAATAAILDEAGLKASLHAASRRSMKHIIAERLATMIGSGALAIGDPLPSERELSSAMGVSRETIRGAVLILSTRGILAVAQGARTTVASDDVGELGLRKVLPGTGDYDLDDVHEGRLLVEAHLARAAARTVDGETLGRLRDLVGAQERATDDPVRYLILDREFHAVVYRSTGNRVLSDLAITLYAYLLNHRRRAVARPGAIARSIEDHRAILAALEEGDGERAAAAFGVHERRIYETTRRLIERDGRPVNGGDQP